MKLRDQYPLTVVLIEKLNQRATICAASLLAAVDLLEGGGRKRVASDSMFKQILRDYRKAAKDLAAARIPLSK